MQRAAGSAGQRQMTPSPTVVGRDRSAGCSPVATFDEEVDPAAAYDAGKPHLGVRVPSQIVVHVALLLGQAINGGGAVVAKMGLPMINPIFFALLRETLATPILAILARAVDGPVVVARQDLRVLAFASLALCSNQIGYITGLKMANPVVGSAWQPSQPVFVLAMAVALGWETCSLPKFGGVLCCMFGGATMTLAGAKHTSGSGGNEVLGNIMFFFNCAMTAVFVLTMRVATRRVPPNTALAIVYAMASAIICVFASGVSLSESARTLFCHDCEGFWIVPSGAVFALAYWVLGTSVLAYSCLAFGTKHAKEATHCLAYTAVQPVSAAILQSLLVATGWNKWHLQNPMQLPGRLQILGGCLVMMGVFMVASDAKAGDTQAHDAKAPTGSAID
mmetsp:Transcript_11576/g.33347  ORF Transcript_11576/g.33347 Transcript_11576/m.33347 type:complete len:391 (-) Transcript_11576:77-1249(-)